MKEHLNRFAKIALGDLCWQGSRRARFQQPSRLGVGWKIAIAVRAGNLQTVFQQPSWLGVS